jgi:hypothetical protein
MVPASGGAPRIICKTLLEALADNDSHVGKGWEADTLIIPLGQWVLY